MNDVVPYSNVLPCRKLVMWQESPAVSKPSCLTIDLSERGAPKIELKTTQFISRGNEIEITPEKLVYRPDALEFRRFLHRATRLPADKDNAAIMPRVKLTATPESVTATDTYQVALLGINSWHCFRTSLTLMNPAGGGINFPFTPSQGMRFYDMKGEPVGRSAMSHAVAMSTFHSLLAAL